MKFVITGATSFIGLELINLLLSQGHSVVAVCRSNSKGLVNIPEGVGIVTAEMSEYGELYQKIDEADVFVNLAWGGTGHDGRNVVDVQRENIANTTAAMKTANKMGCKVFLEAGSQAEYGSTLEMQAEDKECNPFSEYGKAKLEVKRIGFELSEKLKFKYIHLRIFSMFGENDHPWTLVMSALDKMLKNEQVDLSPCTQNWNFIYVKDAVKIMSRLCSYAIDTDTFVHEVYNIGSNDTRQLKVFVEEMKQISQSDSILNYGANIPQNMVSLQPSMRKTLLASNFKDFHPFDEVIKIIINKKKKMIKVSNYIFQHLVEKHGIEHCFLVTGGGAMHLNDAIGHTPGLTYICNHHEQASAIAAEGYYRTCGKLCVTNVTTGPGGTNAITGVLGQYLDSIPALYISGQIKTATYKHTYPYLNLRQLGDQEADIVSVVSPITKYAKTIYNPLDIKYELDKAIAIALDGRPGPVWLDIPLDVQGAMIDETQMKDFDESELIDPVKHELVNQQIKQLVEKIKDAKAPVIYVGNGVRLAKREKQFITLAEKLNIPVVTAISGSDIIWHDHDLCFGKPGICGDRIGNIMVQNSDLLIVMGTRLSIRQTSYAYDLLAPKAYKVMIDIDLAEMEKPTLNIDMAIHANLSEFIDKLSIVTESFVAPEAFEAFKKWGRNIQTKLPTLFDDNPDNDGYTNSYKFADELFKQLHDGDVVVTGNGTAYTCTYQAMQVNKGVRVFANQGCAAMGYDLPAAIGAVVSNEAKENGIKGGRTVLVTGDGSLQMNIQELQTLLTYKMPLKIFVLENEGYLAIKTTQKSFLKCEFTGSNPESGVICPNLSKIAAAYGIPYVSISENGQPLKDVIAKTLASDGPMICEIHMHPEQTLFPKSASFMDKKTGKMSSAPLEKMAPFMSEELQAQCVYNPE